MRLPRKEWWPVIKETFQRFFNDDPFRHSAAIAYFTIFSLPGIAIISVIIAGSFYENDTVRQELIKQVSLLMGEASAEQVQLLMNKALITGESVFMKIVGGITVFISATTVFATLQQTLNIIWRIKPNPRKMWLQFILNRLLSFAMIASIGFLILVSLMADTLIAIVRGYISNFMGNTTVFWITAANITFSLAVVTLIFAFIFRVLPDAKIRWKDVWTGAIFTTILFVGGKYLIGFYLGKSSFNDVYGAAGSLVILLAWVYYSILILLLGAQFTFVYNKKRGRSIVPDDEASAILIKEIDKGDKAVTDLEE